jgi:hypothetical protein
MLDHERRLFFIHFRATDESLFVPELDRLFVAVRAGFFGLGSGVAILVERRAD